MAHNRNYRRARNTFCRVIFNFRNFGRVFFRRQRNYFYIKFRAYKLCCFKINILINGNHYAKHKQGFDNFINFAFNEICKVFNVNAFANFNAGRPYNRCLYCRLLRFAAAEAFFHHMVAAVHVAAVAACILAFNLRFFIAFFVKLLFAALLTAADKLGMQYVATTHRARVETGADGVHTVCPPAGTGSDDSTILAALPQETLARLILPLGDFAPEDVAEMAEDFKV